MTSSGLIICSAFLAGAFIMVWIMMVLMRRRMVIEHESQYGFEETIGRLRRAVEKMEGWVLPIPEWPFYDAMAKHGKPFKSVDRLMVFFLCNASHAQKMINSKPEMASMMPCGWTVYERQGKTYIGSMNIPLMALLFKGIQKEVFRNVGREERTILQEVLHGLSKIGRKDIRSPQTFTSGAVTAGDTQD